jgi:hypothetical protein
MLQSVNTTLYSGRIRLYIFPTKCSGIVARSRVIALLHVHPDHTVQHSNITCCCRYILSVLQYCSVCDWNGAVQADNLAGHMCFLCWIKAVLCSSYYTKPWLSFSVIFCITICKVYCEQVKITSIKCLILQWCNQLDHQKTSRFLIVNSAVIVDSKRVEMKHWTSP